MQPGQPAGRMGWRSRCAFSPRALFAALLTATPEEPLPAALYLYRCAGRKGGRRSSSSSGDGCRYAGTPPPSAPGWHESSLSLPSREFRRRVLRGRWLLWTGGTRGCSSCFWARPWPCSGSFYMPLRGLATHSGVFRWCREEGRLPRSRNHRPAVRPRHRGRTAGVGQG